MIIKLATLDGLNRRKDRSVTMRLTTAMEQSSEEFKVLDMMHQQHVMIAMKPESTPFLDDELKDLDSVDMDLEDRTKTPSKRLRDVLYIYHQQELGRKPTNTEWKEFYKVRMERLITSIKDKLE